MTDARYLLVDVFTPVPFGGNQLAVFPDAAGLEGAQMQAIARELNLAESTFVTPGSAPGRFRVRIFTPAAELPFAGHPTVGTAVVLAHLGRAAEQDAIVLEEGVGPVRVALRPGGATFFMDGAPERRALDVPAADMPRWWARRRWTVHRGRPARLAFLFIPVPDIGAVAAAALRLDRWNALAPRLWGRGVHVHAITGHAGATTSIHARMFAPGLGVAEDPATGSAAAALARQPDRAGIRQGPGAEPGVRAVDDGPTRASPSASDRAVAIGGGAVVVGEGRFDRLP